MPVHYGAGPDRLNETAKSPIRLNPNHSTTLFRVGVNHLKEDTTYYFKVNSMGADGVGDGVVAQLRTSPFASWAGARFRFAQILVARETDNADRRMTPQSSSEADYYRALITTQG
jgi:hypothetical protein